MKYDLVKVNQGIPEEAYSKVNSKLKIEPVPFYKSPKYPTKAAILINPALLGALPQRWKAVPSLCVALTLTISTGLYGCAKDERDNDDEKNLSVSVPVDGSDQGNDGNVLSVSVPVFEHGTGRGAYGCEMVAPPVYLSEEEALQIIREEAEAQGIDFSDTQTIEGNFPATNIYYGDDEFETRKGEIELDGYDPDLKIGFEYVSTKDVEDWAKKTDYWCSVSIYDMKGTAERLSKVVENTAVFYDPGADSEAFEMNWEADADTRQAYLQQYQSEQKELMRENLRAQVRDFLEWLAAEGII